MNPPLPHHASIFLAVLTCLCIAAAAAADEKTNGISKAQVPSWSAEDMAFFLHGSMSTEVVPEPVMRAFFKTYPDLFPAGDLSHLGVIADPGFGWPVGFTRRPVSHLGGLVSVGVNCAACHVSEVIPPAGGAPIRILGSASHFDVEGYFGSVVVAMFRTADPANMKKFLAAWLTVSDPAAGDGLAAAFDAAWSQQEGKIKAAMAADPSGAKGIAPGAMHTITGDQLRLDGKTLAAGADLAALAHSILKLFHNMRAAVHVPDQPPDKAPPTSGPGRNDAFGLISAALLGVLQPYAPVKYGLVWNGEKRRWVHWDGNTRSPIGRNMLAALGLGAPLEGKHGKLNFADLMRHTNLSERISPPRYPFALDAAAADRGAVHYKTHCASCHSGPEGDNRLYDPLEIGTDSLRPLAVTSGQAERFNKLLEELQIPGYTYSGEPGVRSTQKLWAASMDGVWARSPYLHNGSVRTMQELLSPPASRAKSFRRGSRVYDTVELGYADDGNYVLDTTTGGNANSGHSYGTELMAAEKRDLIEFLKTQ